MTVLTEAPGNLPTIQWQDNDSSDRRNKKICLLFNAKLMTVLTEAPGNLPSIHWQDNDSSDRRNKKICLLFNYKIMTVLTEAPETCLLFIGKIMLVNISTKKPAFYSLAR